MNHQSLMYITLFLACINLGIAQNLEKTRDDSNQIKYEMVTELEKEDLDKGFSVDIPANAKSIRYAVEGIISHGNLKISVRDSNDRSEGMFHLTTNSKGERGSKKHSTAKGNYENVLDHPIQGKWTINVEADEVEGDFHLVVVIYK